MKHPSLFTLMVALLLPLSSLSLKAELLIPVRTDVAGFSGWSDVNVAGTTYLQLLVAGASTTSPALDFSAYSAVQLDFKARTYGGTNVSENTISIHYSTDQGANWNLLGTRIPASSTMTAMEAFTITTINASQVLIRFSVAGTNGSIGAGIDDISFNGFVGQQATLTLSKEGSEYAASGFPFTGYAGSEVTLPLLPDEGEWRFRGWDANPAVQTVPAWKGGAVYTTTTVSTTLYAIYSRTDYSGESWSKVTTLNNILPGEYVISNGDFYLPNATVVNGPEQHTLLASNVFAGNGKLLGEVAPDMRWTLTGTVDAMTLQSTANGSYLYTTDAADGVNVGATVVNWSFETYNDGFAMKDAVNNRYCAVYTAGTDWRSYTSRNYSSYKTNAGVLYLYRLSGTATTTFSPITQTTSWTGALSASWNESANWTNGIPDAGKTAVITVQTLQPEINLTATTGDLVLQPTAELSVKSAGQLTVHGNLLLKSSVEGTATVLNDGLMQVEGTSTVEQLLTARTTAVAGDQWWYVSSPVTGATCAALLQEGSDNRMGYYNEATARYPQLTSGTEVLESGRGYLAEIGTTNLYRFSGTLNNGDVGPLSLSRTLTAGASRGFNMVGNPYPSYINWNALTAFGTPQQRADIRPTIWIRTRTASGSMVFDTFDGEVGTALGVRGEASQFIAPLQAFWVKVNTDGDTPPLTFKNSLRSHRTTSTGAGPLRSSSAITRQLLRIELSGDDQRDETLVVTHPDAIEAYDFYDSDKMSSGVAELFTLVEGRELVINKLPSINSVTYLQLGLRPVAAGNFSIKATELINIDTLSVVLTDRLLNTEHFLHNRESYNFTSDGQSVNDRFTISFRSPRIVSGIEDAVTGALQVSVDRNSCLIVQTPTASGYLRVYDASGKLVFSHPVTGPSTRIEQALSAGIYLVNLNHQSTKISIP